MRYKKSFDYSEKRTIENVVITPELAESMLATMGKNRALRGKVHEYARAMRKGQFNNCTTPISFSKDGKLLDGQHRLNAIIESNTPQTFDIKFGLPSDTVFDRGLTRSLKDEIDCRGLCDSRYADSVVLSMVNTFLNVKFPTESRNFTDQDKADFINKYQKDIDRAKTACAKGKSTAKCRKGAVMAAVLAASIYGTPDNVLQDFCEIINTGYPFNDRDVDPQTAAITLGKYIDGSIYYNAPRTEFCKVCEMALWDFEHSIPRRRPYKKIVHRYFDKINVQMD